MELARATAPGKILWLGGYSVLEKGRVSYVTGVDKRVEAIATLRKDGKILIKSPQFNIDIEGAIDSMGKTSFEKADSKQVEGAKFVRKAVECSCAWLATKGVKITGFTIETHGDPAFGAGEGKSGLGSSAAVTTATVGAVFEECGKPIEKNRETIHKAAQTAHSLAQGKVGSGFDVAAATFGGCKYSRYSPDIIKSLGENPSQEAIAKTIDSNWDCSIVPITLPKNFIATMASFRGQSASTSEMVKRVNAWKAEQPEEYAKVIKALDSENKAAINALEQGDLESFKKHFTKGRQVTKKLGIRSGAPIELDDYTNLIEASEKKGAFCCKLPGAGGGDSIAALCTNEDNKHQLEKFWRGNAAFKLDVIGVNFSNEGVRAEK